MARKATSSGLRARALRNAQRDNDGDDSAVLGASHANAYFSAKRLRQATTNKRKKAGEKDEEEDEERKVKKGAFVVRPVGETVEILRRVDVKEGEWRSQTDKHKWPKFDHLFAKWESQMRAGFSVLLHGVGSKLSLLQSFADALPESDFVVEIHGYLPSIVLRDVVTLLQDEVFNLPPMDTPVRTPLLASVRRVVDFAFDNRQLGFPHVHLVVHSLDGPALRQPEMQACLALLAMAPFVHLIASIDSVNAPALWAEDDAQRFRWVHHRVDTLKPYAREIDLRMSREGKAAEQSISGVRYILQSLTPTDVATLQVVAKLQLASNSTSTSGKATINYADYNAAYTACRKQLTHSTLQSMKNSVKCLEDNGLVKLMRVKNTEKLVIPLPDDLLRSDIASIKTK